MVSSISSTIHSHSTSHHTREVVKTKTVERVVDIEKIHVQRDIFSTNCIEIEKINYTYNILNRTIYQGVNAVGNNLNVSA